MEKLLKRMWKEEGLFVLCSIGVVPSDNETFCCNGYHNRLSLRRPLESFFNPEVERSSSIQHLWSCQTLSQLPFPLLRLQL
jgi:hypothetical protein